MTTNSTARTIRIAKIVLIVHAAVLLIAGALQLFGKLPPADVDALYGRRVGMSVLAIAAVCVLAASGVSSDRRFLLFPAVFELIMLADSAYELVALGNNAFVGPALVELIFGSAYVALYSRLPRAKSGSSQAGGEI